jgi:steroid delta-isomerase-like uncharacterized protein
MSEQENIQIVRSVFDGWNAHDAKRAVKSFDSTYVSEADTLSAAIHGPDAAQKFIEMYLHAFPDLHFTIEQILATGSSVITRWHATGTHRGELMGIPPTNRAGSIHGCTVNELKNGKIVREWAYWDGATLLRNIGILPPP